MASRYWVSSLAVLSASLLAQSLRTLALLARGFAEPSNCCASWAASLCRGLLPRHLPAVLRVVLKLTMASDGAPWSLVLGGGVGLVPLGSPGAKGQRKRDGKGEGKSARFDLDGYVLVDPMGNQQRLTNKQAKQLARHRGMSLGNAPPYQPPATWDRRGGGKGGGGRQREGWKRAL